MGNSESKVDAIKSNAKEYKIIFVLGGPGSGKGTQVRTSNAVMYIVLDVSLNILVFYCLFSTVCRARSW